MIRWWALTQYDYLHSVHRRRCEAVQRAIRLSGEPWVICKKNYNIRKVVVTEGWPHFTETEVEI